MWTAAATILINSRLGDFDWCIHNWYLLLVFAICFTVPIVMMLTLQRITIDLSRDKFESIYLVNNNKNGKDLHSNWNIHPSEIESVKIVKLSQEEKRQYTSARFLFRKYLKVNIKFDHPRYVYVSLYSNHQIKRIVQMLTNNKDNLETLLKNKTIIEYENKNRKLFKF